MNYDTDKNLSKTENGTGVQGSALINREVVEWAFLFFCPFLGTGVAGTAWRKFSWESWVHYQVIKSEKP